MWSDTLCTKQYPSTAGKHIMPSLCKNGLTIIAIVSPEVACITEDFKQILYSKNTIPYTTFLIFKPMKS